MKKFNNEYPIEKYTFTIEGNVVTAKSTYAGKEVIGKAKCADTDEFNEETGKILAATRCNAKVAKLRRARALDKFNEAFDTLQIVFSDYKKAIRYHDDAKQDYKKAMNQLRSIEDKLKQSGKKGE